MNEIIDFITSLGLWSFVIVIGTWWGVTGWFFALAHGAELRDRGVKFGWFVKGGIYPFLATGLLLDVIFNVIHGTIIFRELPREWLFTQRVKRLVRENHPKAMEWRNRLNRIMPGHV